MLWNGKVNCKAKCKVSHIILFMDFMGVGFGFLFDVILC